MAGREAGGDVLHFSSIRCHSWGHIHDLIVQCVVLEDMVALLQWHGTGDILYFTTSGLDCWTRCQLRYGYSSLSTYNDQLVAVGGTRSSNNDPTNKVLTSRTGGNWKATLPRMHTKRYAASSVNVKSLSILVVAGGYGTLQYVCSVEVLQDNQWRTVDPLPKVGYDARSTLLGNSIYFTGGDGQRNIIYTCTCNSLCTANDENIVWMEIPAPNDTVTLATCSSRVISIDRFGVIRSYCEGKWIEATIEGDWLNMHTTTLAAAELLTGDIVVAYEWGVCKLTTVSEVESHKYLENSCEDDNIKQDKGFSLADYPPLPTFVNDEKKKVVGFSADKEISVMYTGENGSLDWKECGISLLFESNDRSSEARASSEVRASLEVKASSEVSVSPIRVLAGKTGAFRYPPKIEPASTVYHIDSPKQLPAPVTIKIKHSVPEEDIQNLCFITSTEKQPPYDYTILSGGNFTPTFAEITVKNFSFFLLAILRKYRVKGALSIREKSYVISLHYSLQPILNDSRYSWNVYVSAVKNCSCFKRSIKIFIKEEYEDDVKLYVKKICNFADTEDSIIASTSCEHSLGGTVLLKPSGSPSIEKMHISRYVDATIPHIKYDLQVVPQQREASLEIEIALKGLKKPEYLCLHLTVPQWSSPLPATLPNRTINLSSLEQESHTHSGYAFTMKNLRVLHIGPDQQLHLIEEISPQWKEAGDILGLRISHTRVIAENYSQNVVDCCREVMAEWLDNAEGTYNYPPSWQGLCGLLKDLKLSTAAQHIQNSVLKE